MPEKLLGCPESKICGLSQPRCEVKSWKSDRPCEGVDEDKEELTTGLDRSSEGPSVKPKNEEGELSLEQLRIRQQKLQNAVDARVDVQDGTVIAGQPPCEDHRGRPVDRFGRRKR